MTPDYRVIPLEGAWPGIATIERRHALFKENWTGTLKLLESELRHLDARDVTLALTVEPFHLRQDGQMRSDARVRDSGVILSFTSHGDRLSFPCDTFLYWQHNVRAIALALDALRMVDRYGVQKGRQYVGFKALPGAGGSTQTLSVGEAAQIIAQYADGLYTTAAILSSSGKATEAIRRATRNTHPDMPGGSGEDFTMVSAAKAVLGILHGTRG
jgi:hypothetical protein